MTATSTSDSLPLGPVTRAERIEVLDILRGWAIFGVLLVNMTFDQDWSDLFDKLWSGPVDQGALVVIEFLFKNKFYTLLSFLFGLGFSIQMGRAESRGLSFLPFYARKLLGLLVIALLHNLVWPGDVLKIYAALGFVLLLFRNMAPRKLLAAAVLCLLASHAFFGVRDARREWRRLDPQTARQALLDDARRASEDRALWGQGAVPVRSRGSFLQNAALNARIVWRWYSNLGFYMYWLGDAFPLFLLGLYAGRRRIFQNLEAHLGLARRIFWWGLCLGVVCLPVYVAAKRASTLAWPLVSLPLANLLDAIGSSGLAFFYAAAIVLLAQRDAWKLRFAPLAAVGRMALTNYLCQTLLHVGLFYGYGLGLYGRLGPVALAGVALAFFPVQVLFSQWWLGRFRFGPVEWVWRSFTYGAPQPIRVAYAAAAPQPQA